MSGEKVKLSNIEQKLDLNLSGSSKGNKDHGEATNYRIFKSKNSRQVNASTERDQEVVSRYQTIIHSIKKVGDAVSSIFQANTKVPTTSLGRSRPTGNENQLKSQPLRTNYQLANTTTRNRQVNRCAKCNCILTVSSGNNCPYCIEQDIEVIDSDSDEFPSIEHCIAPTSRMPNGGQISTASFYSNSISKENSSFENHSISKPNISMARDESEKGIKYDIDYLYIGTYRFISRTYIRLSNENISLFINTGRDGLTIDYKLITSVSLYEPKNQSPRHIYMQIEFNREAVDAINEYVSNMEQDGSFKFDTINGHEKYFIMKLKHLNDGDAMKLRMRLKIQLPKKCRDNPNVFQMFEEQREYDLKNRNRKKQKTSDCRTRSQDRLKPNEIKSDIRNHSRDEPMEVDRIYNSNIPSTTNMRTRSLAQQQERLFQITDRPTRSTYERTPFQKRKPSPTFGSNNSIKSVGQEEDMEISEIAKPKFNLSIKSIKNNKILFEPITGETLVILKTDLQCLNDGNFLNDKIIEFYLLYIKSKLIDSSVAEKTYIFSSFFFTKMLSLTKGSLSEDQFNENLYNLVKKWTKSIDVFEYNYLIVPVFRNYHWSLAIICNPGKMLKDDFEIMLDYEDADKPAIIFMDSMGRGRMFHKYSKYLRNFLQKECLSKKDKTVNFSAQEMTNLDTQVPCQLNGYDCGIFVLHYVELFLKDPKSVIQRIRKSKASLEHWFSPGELKEKRKEIYTILFNIYEENVKNDLKFESDDDLTLNKSDEEIEILTNDDVDKELLSEDEDSMLQ